MALEGLVDMRDRGLLTIEIGWSTIGRLLLTALLVWIGIRIVTVVVVVVIAVILAVTLNPIIAAFEQRRVPRWAASAVVIVVLLAAMGTLLYQISADLNAQASVLGERLRQVEAETLSRLPSGWDSIVASGSSADALRTYAVAGWFALIRTVLRAFVLLTIATILTLYLLIEGRLAYAWLLAFVPKRRRLKVHRTAVECRRVVASYITGNVLTSIFASAFVFISLSALQVPAALLLALVAGVCDFVPVLGFVISAVPAVLLALTISPAVTWAVIGLYILYHGIENYLIGPLVYGDRLHLSNTAVVIALAVGAEFAGVAGALLALPVAAAYPAIERIWLKDTLSPEAVEEHQALEQGQLGA
jgi:predicted PurR-regulated permease PerM